METLTNFWTATQAAWSGYWWIIIPITFGALAFINGLGDRAVTESGVNQPIQGGRVGKWLEENGVGILGVIGAGISLGLAWTLKNPGYSAVIVGSIVFLYGAHVLITKGKATWQQALIASLILIPLGLFLASPRGEADVVKPVYNYLMNVEVVPEGEAVDRVEETRSNVDACPNVVVVRGENIKHCQLDPGRKVTVLVATGYCPYEEADGVWFKLNDYGKWSVQLPYDTADDVVGIGQHRLGTAVIGSDGRARECS